MTSRVGYRALIVDNDVYAFRLSQFIMRPELNNRIIDTYSTSDLLSDAYFKAEQSDFIYIDPFYFGLAEAMRFITEVQSRSPVKAFTLFRSGHQWQEHLRELDTLAVPPARLRVMLSLDKDLMGDALFAQQVRNNIQSMERELQQEQQRHGYTPPDTSAARGGNIYDLGAYRDGGFGASGVGVAYNQIPPGQIREIMEGVAALMRQQSVSPTHPLLTGPALPPGFDALTLQQMKQDVATAQTQIKTIGENHGKLQEAMTKQQDQITASQARLRDYNQTFDGLNGRVQNIESWQIRSEAGNKKLADQMRFLQFVLLSMGIVLAILLVTVLFLLLTGHHS